jgi:hypothetical protein
MKTFEVELRRTSFIVLTIEAETQEEAEALAFQEAAVKGDSAYANWEVESIEEKEE